MSEIAGLVDVIEGLVSDAPRVPFSKKVMVDQQELFALIDKLRILTRYSDQSIARDSIAMKANPEDTEENPAAAQATVRVDKQILEKAKEEAEAVVANADQYADALLAKLQLTVTKMQQNLIRLERNLQDGRQLVSDQSQGHRKDKDETESTPSE